MIARSRTCGMCGVTYYPVEDQCSCAPCAGCGVMCAPAALEGGACGDCQRTTCHGCGVALTVADTLDGECVTCWEAKE